MFRKLSDFGLISFAAISALVALALIYLGQTKFEDDVAAIFDSNRGEYSSTRVLSSSEYLLTAMQSLSAIQTEESGRVKVLDNLDLAYNSFNLDQYRQSFPCVDISLNKITEIRDAVIENRYLLSDTAALWSQVLFCQNQVIAEQANSKNALAREVITRSADNKHWFTAGILLAYIISILLWLTHERERERFVSTLREKLRWQRRAETDHLTGCFNRLALDQALNDKLQNPAGKGYSMVVLYDLDYFKAYNDFYGHVKGDNALKKVVAAVESVLRAEDRQFRFGGEEFVVLSENINRESAVHIAGRALEAVRDLNIPHAASSHGKLTISLGCYTIAKEDSSAEAVIEKTDKLLYQAKAGGRNQFAC